MKSKTFSIAMYTSLILFALTMNRALTAGILDGSAMLWALPIIIWYFVVGTHDYIAWCKEESRKEAESNERRKRTHSD